jgi:hypothetical protein
MTSDLMRLGIESRALDISAKSLDGWERAAAAAGSTAERMAGTLGNFQKTLTKFGPVADRTIRFSVLLHLSPEQQALTSITRMITPKKSCARLPQLGQVEQRCSAQIWRHVWLRQCHSAGINGSWFRMLTGSLRFPKRLMKPPEGAGV